nr:ribosome assembly RNA-binding protein YhbY [Fredinandcohnia onubensis]
MLTGKQKRFLRSKAHHLDPIFQVGKGGVNENMVKQISDALEARELLKVSVLQNCEDDRDTVAQELSKGAKAELVQIIGNTIVLYKESKENKQLELPKANK